MRKRYIGLVIRPGSNLIGGETPRHFFTLGRTAMRELSIFVDESGDFGEYDVRSPYYIISMILHDQSNNLSFEISKLDSELTNLGFENHVVHTEPLIRREEDYKDLSPNERRNILIKLYYFVIKCKIRYKSFVFQKKEFDSIFKLEGRMAREIAEFIRENLTYFQGFET